MKKWKRCLLLLATAFMLTAAIYVVTKISYSGNNSIILLNAGQSYTSLQKILQQPEFKNKVVYVDVWGTSCPPCFDELKNYTPLLTERYKDAGDIAFLYICVDGHPLPELRWKDKIQLLQPKGFHVLVEAAEERRLATDIIGSVSGDNRFPYLPCYFIVDKKGQIVKKPLPIPENGELMPGDKELLYRRLDSLREE